MRAGDESATGEAATSFGFAHSVWFVLAVRHRFIWLTDGSIGWLLAAEVVALGVAQLNWQQTNKIE